MTTIRIEYEDHQELLRRKDLTGASLTFQLSKLIKDSKHDEEKKASVLPAIPERLPR